MQKSIPKRSKPRRSGRASWAAENLLKKLIVLESHDSHGHLWMYEGDRWKELVFALLTRVAPRLPEPDIRTLVERMHSIRLLDINLLASICRGSKTPRLNDPLSRLIVDLLTEELFTKEEAERGLVTICEAALGLHKHFHGKIQKYLRHYGELMLGDFKRYFAFSKLTDGEVQYSLTYWLQNVLSMPVPLVDKGWNLVCTRYGVKPSEVISAADGLDVNLGLLDDLFRSHLARQVSDQNNLEESVPVTEKAERQEKQG